jgi:hypothetical protein
MVRSVCMDPYLLADLCSVLLLSMFTDDELRLTAYNRSDENSLNY